MRALLPDLGADALLVTYTANVTYLSGFTGSNGAVLVGREPRLDRLATDFRYLTQVATQCPDLEVVNARAVVEGLTAYAGAAGLAHLGFEASHLSVAAHAAATAEHRDLVLVPTDGLVEGLRVGEGRRRAGGACRGVPAQRRGPRGLLPEIRVGQTERQVARRLEWLMLEAGADAISFETIVASGPHSAIPHHSPTDRPIERGDLLKIDFGALHAGYHADETRTFVVAADPEPWQVELHALVARAQQAGIDALGVGVEVRDVDHAARSVIAAAGHAEHFGHGLGHGVGLTSTRRRCLGHSSTGILGDRTPVTVEPGSISPGAAGSASRTPSWSGPVGRVSLTTTDPRTAVLQARLRGPRQGDAPWRPRTTSRTASCSTSTASSGPSSSSST